MKLPKGSLSRLITDQFGVKRDTDTFYIVLAHSLSYLTGGISAFQYQANIKPLCKDAPVSAKDFRLLLCSREYMSLNIKLFVYRLAKLRGPSDNDLYALRSEYGLYECDAHIIYAFWLEQRKFRRRLKASAKQFDADTHLNLAVIKAGLEEVFKEVMRKIRSTSYKKLRFICDSQNLELRDMHNELTVKVVQAYYKQMPSNKTMAHMVNYLKRAVRNHATNIIDANTSKKAGRLINTSTDPKVDKFSLVVVSENQMRIASEDDGPINYEELGAHDPREALDLQFSIAQILGKLKTSSKKYRILTILMGHDDADFTQWLIENKHIRKDETNVDAQHRLSVERFNVLTGRFFRISRERVELFLSDVRSSLAVGGDEPQVCVTPSQDHAISPVESSTSVPSRRSRIRFHGLKRAA